LSWQPPWPPIRIGPGEWILMRDSRREPAAVVRHLQLGPRREWYFRVVTWAETSDGRELVGYYPTLEEADRSVKFRPPVLSARSGPPNGGGVTHAGSPGRAATARRSPPRGA
jgi:hypothetical protein